MRVEYINPFVDAAINIIKDVINNDVTKGKLYLKNTTQNILGVAVIVGLAGDVEGRVLFDMTKETAINITSAMNNEKFVTFDELGKATIMELANLITANAVTKLHELGFSFDLTPPAIFTGDNMEVTGSGVEALIVPLEMTQGRVEINVAIRERL